MALVGIVHEFAELSRDAFVADRLEPLAALAGIEDTPIVLWSRGLVNAIRVLLASGCAGGTLIDV